jgi:hypothetical protein
MNEYLDAQEKSESEISKLWEVSFDTFKWTKDPRGTWGKRFDTIWWYISEYGLYLLDSVKPGSAYKVTRLVYVYLNRVAKWVNPGFWVLLEEARNKRDSFTPEAFNKAWESASTPNCLSLTTYSVYLDKWQKFIANSSINASLDETERITVQRLADYHQQVERAVGVITSIPWTVVQPPVPYGTVDPPKRRNPL